MHAKKLKREEIKMKVSKSKLLATAIVLVMFASMFAVLLTSPAEAAYVNKDMYAYLEGVLGNDSYTLYPYTSTSLDIGFSKYGEMINPDEPVGLSYGGVDPFANSNVSQILWIEGWLINMTFEYSGVIHNIWAYSLYSDGYNYTNKNWVNKAKSALDNRPGYTGGRKTNGYATTDPMQVLYDGPRRAIVLLKSTIYDPTIINPKAPTDPKGLPLVDIYIQVDFNKVKKYVLLIKDIKLRAESKMLEKVQVKFGQRGQWDLGAKPEDWQPYSYAHFYHMLPTKYFKNPWYTLLDDQLTGYDLCQIIDYDQNYVAYAAYWPNLMSWRVESINKLNPNEIYGDLSDWEHNWVGAEGTEGEFVASIPGYYQDPLYYPVGAPPVWTDATPEVYVDGVLQTLNTQYTYDVTWGVPGGYDRGYPGETVAATPGTFYLYFIHPQADTSKIYVHWKLHAEQDDMTTEPRTPFTMGEWVFDLSYADEKLPTNQFRCITVYGINDLNDAVDRDIALDDNCIDKETLYQLDEVFNPWDLRQALGQDSFAWWDPTSVYDTSYNPFDYSEYMRDDWPGKWTERWVQNYTGDGTQDTFWLSQQIVVPAGDDDPTNQFPAWDAYCSPREKVLVDGVLQVPGIDYEISWEYSPEETVATGLKKIKSGDSFQLMYPRIYPDSDYVEVWVEDPYGTPVHYPEYSIDYADGKLYITEAYTLPKDYTLKIGYYLNWPASQIVFYEDSIPATGAHVEVLYSTFRIVYKTDKFLYGIDGLYEENSDVEHDYYDYLLRYGPVVPESWMWWTVYEETYKNWITVLINGESISSDYWDFGTYYNQPYIWVDYSYLELSPGDVIEVIYPIFSGRYEWTTVGTGSAPVDSAGASMVTEGLRQWTNFDTKLGSLDYKDTVYGPKAPYIFGNVSGTGSIKADYYDGQRAQSVNQAAGRAYLKDNWCTTLPISSSNIIVVGGPFANLGAEYFNDFTDSYVSRIGPTWGTGFTSPACWNRTLYKDTTNTGYATISTYKDINGTVGLIIQGWTGQDTYYACYAIQHGLPKILQCLQPGVTSIVLKFNYKVHPTDPGFFTIVESLGTFTECGGFDYVTWEEFGTGLYTEGNVIYKLVMNSYSSEYWVFHITVDFTTAHTYDLPPVVSIEISYPQEINFNWAAKVHPDP